MKLDADSDGNLVIRADGHRSPWVGDVPQGIILVQRDGAVLEVWEDNGRINTRETTVDNLDALSEG